VRVKHGSGNLFCEWREEIVRGERTKKRIIFKSNLRCSEKIKEKFKG